MKNSVVLAFDFGLKNIGVACGNVMLGSATPLAALKARDGQPRWEEIGNLIREWQPLEMIVGLPLNMDGSESEMSARAQKFARRLHGRFGVQVHLFDERLSSAEAKSLARDRGHSGDYGEEPIDSLAASLILQSWWNANPNA